jgi:glycosyltransferase involved in cell wall biosynthesis/aminoglycoside phosphotransferase
VISGRPRVAVLFDTAGFQRSLALTGAAARTLYLNAELAARGVPVRLFLCDLNPQSQPVRTWPFPTTYVDYDSLYADPRVLSASLSSFEPDLLVMSNSQLTARYGRQLAEDVGAALVYEMHDDEGALLRSLGRTADEWQQAAAEQSAAAASADGVIAFSADDARAAKGMTTGSVHVVPCGVAVPPAPADRSQKPVMSFVGNLFYAPNRRAADYLCSPGFSGHLSRLGASVEIYGRYPVALRIDEALPIRFRGPVPFLQQAIASTMIGLAPLDSGGGMKLKVLEYMAAGIPIAGTAVAAAGFDEFEEFGLIGRADLSDFPDLVAQLLKDPVRRARLAARGRQLAETTYSWRRMAELAEEAYAAIRVAAASRITAPSVLLDRYTIEKPYWLREWISQQQPSAAGASPVDTGNGVGVPPDLYEAIDCARVAAQARTGIRFPRSGSAGYNGRSMVYLADRAALKVYTHHGADRIARETAGLAAVVAGLTGFEVPTLLAGDSPPGALSWVAVRRIPGEGAKAAETAEGHFAEQIGLLLARLHKAAGARAGALSAFHRSPQADAPGFHPVGRRLAHLYRAAESSQKCVDGFVHGSFSTRNVLVASGALTGIVDFERSGRGCAFHDLASAYLTDALLGSLSGPRFLSGYATALGRGEEVDVDHLGLHLMEYAAWILGWAPAVDPKFAAQVVALAPRLEKPSAWQ